MWKEKQNEEDQQDNARTMKRNAPEVVGLPFIESRRLCK